MLGIASAGATLHCRDKEMGVLCRDKEMGVLCRDKEMGVLNPIVVLTSGVKCQSCDLIIRSVCSLIWHRRSLKVQRIGK